MKGKVLKALYESEGHISGERLSQELGVSRVSVWKYIQSLKQDGYIIEASKKGYYLVSSPDSLLPWEFPQLEAKIHHFKEIGSTMDFAQEIARKGEEGIVIAETQTKGRGRLGRQWHSPEGGIYFTLILKPKISPVYAPRVTLMAGISVVKAIRRLFDLKAELKWPNDVQIRGRKVGGILAEMEAETDVIKYVNLGIGINANSLIPPCESKPISLKEILGRGISRKELLSSVLEEIEIGKAKLERADLIEEWKSLATTLGKEVRVIAPGETVEGRAIDIDSSGALIIKRRDGSLATAVAGDCIYLENI